MLLQVIFIDLNKLSSPFSAFFWLLSLLMSSLLWLICLTLDGPLAVGLVCSVFFQELFRYFIYLVLRKAEDGLKKLTESPDTAIITNKNILAYGIIQQ